jgi:hypothetical protein
MNCSACHRPMRPLFISYVCDYCDGLHGEPVEYDHGFVVWRPRPTPAQEYVFSTRRDAERWRTIQGLSGYDIREVLTATKFRWRKSTGSVKGLEMADRLIEIFPDRRHPPGPNRAFFGDATEG